MDLTLFRFINNLALQNQVLDQVMTLLSSYGIIIMIIAIIALFFQRSNRVYAIVGVASLALSLLVNRVLKISIDRPRPFMDHSVNLVIDRAPSPSFPSDQALIAGVFLLVMWLVLTKLKSLACLFAAAVLFSRVYVGHHYPSDVLVGCMVGVFLSFVLYSSYRKWKNRPQLNKPLDL